MEFGCVGVLTGTPAACKDDGVCQYNVVPASQDPRPEEVKLLQ